MNLLDPDGPPTAVGVEGGGGLGLSGVCHVPEVGQELLRQVAVHMATPSKRPFNASAVEKEQTHAVTMELTYVLLSEAEFGRVFGMKCRAKDPRAPKVQLRSENGDLQTYHVFKMCETGATHHRLLKMTSSVAEVKSEMLLAPPDHLHLNQADEVLAKLRDTEGKENNSFVLGLPQAWSSLSTLDEYKARPFILRLRTRPRVWRSPLPQQCLCLGHSPLMPGGRSYESINRFRGKTQRNIESTLSWTGSLKVISGSSSRC